jgi:hypothetical protein
MKMKRFSEEQIIGILKEAEAGAVVLDLCGKHGMSSATFFAWKAKYGGLEPTLSMSAPSTVVLCGGATTHGGRSTDGRCRHRRK